MTNTTVNMKELMRTRGALGYPTGKQVVEYILRRYTNICATMIENSIYYLTPDMAAQVLHCCMTDWPAYFELFLDMANKYIRNNNLQPKDKQEFDEIVKQMMKMFIQQSVKYNRRNRKKAKAWINYYLKENPSDLNLMMQSCMFV